MFENEIYIKVTAYLLSVGGLLLGVIGALVIYIFREHIKDNNLQFDRNRKDHERIYDKIESKADKRK
jgi:hypothetical protein